MTWTGKRTQEERPGDNPKKEGGLSCSFCGKSQHEVKKLIAGPTVYICDECISLCNDIIAEEVSRDERMETQQKLDEAGRRGLCADAAGDLSRLLAFVPGTLALVEKAKEIEKEMRGPPAPPGPRDGSA
jgi:hypothetical protein